MTFTVLITGASQGIGKATALLFAQKGYNLVLAAREPERLAEVTQTIQNQRGKAVGIPTDVTNCQQVDLLVEKALEHYGQVDILINNAGICMTAPMEETTLENWQQVINVNLWGYIYTIHALLPHFIAQKKGIIVNVGSIGGKIPLPHMTAYCTSKYAVTGLTETLRLELVPKGIQVCCVHPSVTNSDFLERAIFSSESRKKQMEETLKSAIASQPEDVAKSIWDAIQNPKAEIMVGSGAIFNTIYRLVPGLSQWLMKQSITR